MAARRPNAITFHPPENYRYVPAGLDKRDGFTNALRASAQAAASANNSGSGVPQYNAQPPGVTVSSPMSNTATTQSLPQPQMNFQQQQPQHGNTSVYAFQPDNHYNSSPSPPTAFYTPPGTLPEAPRIEHPPPHQRFASYPPGNNLILGMHPVHALRLCLGVTFALIVIISTCVLLFAMLTRDSHHHMDLEIAPSPPAMILAHGLTEDSQWKQFVFNFTTTNALFEEQRYPPAGGSFTDYVDGFAYEDVITDYDVCCLHQELRLICISRGAAFNHGNYMIDGEVDWLPGDNEVFLRLLVNSEQLLGVECFMTGRYFKT